LNYEVVLQRSSIHVGDALILKHLKYGETSKII